jgi:hypothetical protein
MAGYMDGYGVEDARREKIRNRVAIALVVLLVVGVTLYFLFRNYKEEQQLKAFFNYLRNNDYAAAYTLWGCTVDNPCRDYKYESFMEDWGPAGAYSKLDAMEVVRTRSCVGSVIQNLTISGQEVDLIVHRDSLLIGFSPWKLCDPRLPEPTP